MLAIIAVNYAIGWVGVRVPSMAFMVPPATWIFNCVILLLNERYNGYSWVALLGIGGLGGESWDSPRGHAALWLDNHRGVFPWFRLFNLVVLRMISFNMDRHWAALQIVPRDRDGGVITFEKHQRKCLEGCMIRGREGACLWWREKDSHALSSYTPLAYFAYLFYVPLHFAGPTITFNSWLGQIVHPQRSYTPLGVAWYALGRTGFIFLVLEAWLHLFYVFSFTNSPAFLGFSPYGMALVSYFTLVAIWLKFTALWRFFRCWSLLDGVEPPENMSRCVSNNYSVQSFWRGWHRSFNRWLVRYVYVPLGGGGGGAASPATTAATGDGKSSSSSAAASSGGVLAALWSSYSTRYPRLAPLTRQLANVFLTFSFVAFWHDRTMQLLAWGWMIALLFAPELGAQALCNTRALKPLKTRWYWRHIKGVGAAMSIFTMMVTNEENHARGRAQPRTGVRRAEECESVSSLTLAVCLVLCVLLCPGRQFGRLQRGHPRHLVNPAHDGDAGRIHHVRAHLRDLLLGEHDHVRM